LSCSGGIVEIVWDTSQRLLRLLALLQRRREWGAGQLASELDVTERTVRRDIARLRDLGYPVATVHGTGGGYQLQAGAMLPPLMFDADEAVATLLALRDWAASGQPDNSDGALSALDKLGRVMPPRLRPALQALSAHSSSLGPQTVLSGPPGPVTVATLILLARACRDDRQVTFSYRRHDGQVSVRRVEPLHLVAAMGRWYLVAYCLEASGWRTFRADRISDPAITRHPCRRHEPPAADLHDYVTAQIGVGMRQVTAVVRVHAPRDAVARWILPAWGTVTEETPETCIVRAGADSYQVIARWLLLPGARLTVIRPAELRAAFAELATTIARIASDADPGQQPGQADPAQADQLH
jgi:predicted DNA-binding transcriptional regulator YafY